MPEVKVVKIYKNKKVIAALVGLIVALVAALAHTEIADGTSGAVVNLICSVVECQ